MAYNKEEPISFNLADLAAGLTHDNLDIIARILGTSRAMNPETDDVLRRRLLGHLHKIDVTVQVVKVDTVTKS